MPTLLAQQFEVVPLVPGNVLTVTVVRGQATAVRRSATQTVETQTITSSASFGPYVDLQYISLNCITGRIDYAMSQYYGQVGVNASQNPGGTIVGMMGDSITAQNVSLGTVQETIGYMVWAKALLRQGIYSPPELNFGVGGERTDQMLLRMPAAVFAMQQAGARFCVILAGTNNFNSVVPGTNTPEAVISDLTAMYALCKAAGIGVVAIPILPRGGGNALSTDYRRGMMHRINRWIRNRPQIDNNVIVADPTQFMTDGTSATGDNLSQYFSDGLHPNEPGARLLGGVVANVLTKYVTTENDGLITAVNDTYDATNNATGSIVVNGLMAGTGGTIVLGTGQVADNWTGSRDSGTNIGTLTAAWSKVARTDGRPGVWQRAVVSGTPLAQRSVMLQQIITPGATTYVAGDVIEGMCEITIASGAVGLLGVQLQLRNAFDATTSRASDFDINSNAVPILSEALTLVLKTPRLTIPSGVSLVDLQPRVLIGCLANTAITADVMISRVTIRKVI